MIIQKFVVEVDGENSIVLGATSDLKELLIVAADGSLRLAPISRCKFVRPLFGADDMPFHHLFLASNS